MLTPIKISLGFSRWRSQLVANLDGRVLEIGVGRGDNLVHYRRAEHVWAIEPDAERAAQAITVAQHSSVPVTVRVAAAEELPFDAGSFDHVVSSLVFCSVADQTQALREIRRVIKPAGLLHMIEHIRPDTQALAWVFSAVTPWWSRIAHNCHLDRPTLDVLAAEGWQVDVQHRRFMLVRLAARQQTPI